MRRWLLLLPAGLVSLSLLSCTDDFAPCPDYRVGVVEGVVTWLEEPAAGITLQATCLGDCDQRRSVTTDSTGSYRLELPEGRYFLRPTNVDPRLFADEAVYAGIRVGPLTSRYDLSYGRVSGLLTVPDGFGDGNVSLRLEGSHGVSLSDDFAVEAGVAAFDFPMVEPGSYRLRLGELSEYNAPFYLSAAAGGDTVDFMVAGDAPTVLERDVTGQLAVITGRVGGAWSWDRDGEARVTAREDRSDWWAGSSFGTDTDDGGNYRLFVLAPLDYTISMNAGSGTIFHGGGSSITAATVFSLQPGEMLSGIDFFPTRLEVRLRGPHPWSNYGTIVLTLQELDTGLETEFGVSANPIVRFDVDPGIYRVHVSGACGLSDWLPQWYGGAMEPELAQPVELPQGGNTILEFELAAGGSVAGRVTASDGSPLPEVLCRLFTSAGEPTCSHSSTAPSFPAGEVRFAGLPDGDYLLGAQVVGSDPVWFFPGTFVSADADTLRVRDLGAVTDLEWALPVILEGGH